MPEVSDFEIVRTFSPAESNFILEVAAVDTQFLGRSVVFYIRRSKSDDRAPISRAYAMRETLHITIQKALNDLYLLGGVRDKPFGITPKEMTNLLAFAWNQMGDVKTDK